jgi:superoxide dismutase
VDAHEFVAVPAASQRKFGAGKRFDQRFPKVKKGKGGGWKWLLCGAKKINIIKRNVTS